MDEKKIKIIVLTISTILMVFGYLTRDVGVFANTLIISTFTIFSTFAFF